MRRPVQQHLRKVLGVEHTERIQLTRSIFHEKSAPNYIVRIPAETTQRLRSQPLRPRPSRTACQDDLARRAVVLSRVNCWRAGGHAFSPPQLPFAEAHLLGGLFWVISFLPALFSATSRSRSRCVISSCP